ncbi:OLC1v1033496C1 [Oldenlandia corymbosa var. corymbosa]|uniref:RING-type E3 ubiquitin transferase n=1 Tax=Oldenlandia corymbosa var. corymbosa TaxID=529605 RepID=A0AAV1CNA8_OLDCO|nr:OLC1v1033496C1 [Oldenlandia corymbosa var. corymbosa]
MNDRDDLAPVVYSGLCASCALCHRCFPPENEAGDLQAVITICGDCKFLLLEDHRNPALEDYERELRRLSGRMRHHVSSESFDDLFSRRFSHAVNPVRQNQANSYENDYLMLSRRTSTRTTPSGSRRRRWVSLSDTETDGFDSFLGESESNFSFGSSRFMLGENDSISLRGSDAFADDHNGFFEIDEYSHAVGGVSENEPDTDIDPMHAGLYPWNSEDIEEDDDESVYNGWEENTFASVGPGSRVHSRQHALSPHQDSTMHLQIQEMTTGTIMLSNSEEQNYVPSPELQNYLRLTGVDEMLEHLAETENSSSRGAPPAAISFVHSLPQLVITGEDHPEGKLEEDGLLACAICKDSLPVGTVVNQLPCSHLYHPSCILPWLSSRNSCPLCRYELPTDDKDYNDRKQHRTTVLLDFERQIQQLELSDRDGYSEVDQEIDASVGHAVYRANTRRGWVYLAAATAPFFGVLLMLCFGGNRVAGRGCRRNDTGTNFSSLGRHPIPAIRRDSGQNNRPWWFPF